MEIPVSQDVVVSVDEISAFSISGSVTLTLDSFSSGPGLDEDADASTTYAVTVNGTSKKITASLDAAFGIGLSLTVLMDPPTGGVSTPQILSTTDVDLVTSFGLIAESGLTITYTASGTLQAVPNGSGVTRTVTYTLADN